MSCYVRMDNQTKCIISINADLSELDHANFAFYAGYESSNQNDDLRHVKHFLIAVLDFLSLLGFASVEAFDPSVGAWKSVAPMAVSRSSVGVGVLGGRVYAVGGYDGQSRRCLASVEVYDPRENRWETVREMNQRRSGPAVAEMDGRLYVVGGHDGLLVRNSCEFFDPQSGVWCGIADMHFCRRNAG